MFRYHIQTIEAPSGGSASFVFNSVPQEYDDLVVVVSARTSQAIDSWSDIGLRFNGDAANYTSRVLYGSGSGNGAGLSETSIFMRVSTANNTANTFASYRAYIPNYRSNSTKSVSIEGANETNATLAIQKISSSLWNSTAAINTVSLVPQSGVLVQHSSASLYGIKRGSDGKTETASGGAISFSGGYTIHTFQSSGTFVANRDLDVEYLVVGGGGGGGGDKVANSNGGGGGGAGGYRSSVQGELSGGGSGAEPKLRVTSGGSYLIQVGAGGAGGPVTSDTLGSQGGISAFGSIASIGGGGGANSGGALSGGNGGSAGGGAGIAVRATGTANQGFDGGIGQGSSTGGGGSAGQQGGDGPSEQVGGNGGNGVSSSITGSAVTRGGGGAGGGFGSGGLPGSGGGGAIGMAGAANTGGGGGGRNNGAETSGGAGGSGIVIIRYLTPA